MFATIHLLWTSQRKNEKVIEKKKTEGEEDSYKFRGMLKLHLKWTVFELFESILLYVFHAISSIILFKMFLWMKTILWGK